MIKAWGLSRETPPLEKSKRYTGHQVGDEVGAHTLPHQAGMKLLCLVLHARHRDDGEIGLATHGFLRLTRKGTPSSRIIAF